MKECWYAFNANFFFYDQQLEAMKKVWTSGCISVIEMWVYSHLYIIAGVAVGVAVAQVYL